jgi:hypothetical protein
VKDGNLRYERHGIRLWPNLQFLSKTQRLNNPWIPIFIPSFHNFATCNSLTLDAVANAIKNTVFHVKYFTSQDKRGSKGGSHNLQSTEGRSQLGISGFKIGFELKIPLINFERPLQLL